MDHLNIKEWAESDRPRERMMEHGPRSLTDAELLAILLRSGSRDETAVTLAQRILARYDNNLDRMGREVSIKTLCNEFKGIGQTKALTIMAALELGRRRRAQEAPERPRIANSADAYEYVLPHLADLKTEEMWVVLLNRQGRVIDARCVGQGGISGVMCDVRVIMRFAIENNASSLILAHNHPSGSDKPSRDDINLTQRVGKACALFDIHLNDHIIVAYNSYYSFVDNGQQMC